MIKFFSASWCTPCNTLKKSLEESDLAKVHMVDVDQEQSEVINASVVSIPTLIKYDEEGNEIARKSGSMTRAQFLDFIE